ncbi:MAG: Zn-dependent protease/predicted transcriptional regulator [Saprospiraceae bacterium]|jgi:Zn-dependent protease/predicted transcriptional regulator
MKGSIKVATMFGIPVKVHWSFSLLILYILYIGYSSGLVWSSIACLVLFVLSLFFCVVLHEYGHALTARKYGVETRDIILSPIGGIARLERLPEKPIQEFYVAIAGPLVNIAIVIVIAPLFILIFSNDIVWGEGFVRSWIPLMDPTRPINILPFLLVGNVMLAGFNLLPAFPMDGGRVFRSLLSIKIGRLRATQVASYLGNFFGIAMIAFGIYGGQIMTSLIGVFVFLLATQEYRMVKMETILKNNTVADIFRESFTKIYLDSKIAVAEDIIKRGLEKNFLVFDKEEKLAGILHELFIMEAIKKKDLEGPVAEYLSHSYEAISKTDNLDAVLKKMQEHSYSILPVFEKEELVGVLDVMMMNNFLRLKKKTG